MNFKEHIADQVFGPRLKDKRILVVYDEKGMYGEVCQSLASDSCHVIVTDKRPLSARLEAMQRWQELVIDTTFQSQMLIHCSEPAPKDNDERRVHPFAGYAALGASFPAKAGDEIRQLCYTYLPHRTVEIDQLFAAGDPDSLEVIDSLSGGARSHPRLEGIFGTAEVSRILPAFLVPTDEAAKKLDGSSDWCAELHRLVQQTLGMKMNAKVTNPATMRDKLWRYLLFSEFAHDLPGDLPAALADMPRAKGAQASFSTSLCHGLRNDHDTREAYRERANAVEEELNLPELCRSITDLGDTDTFGFEERRFLQRASKAIEASEWPLAAKILATHKRSLWTEEGERGLLWRVLELGLETLERIELASGQLKDVGAGGKELCEAYTLDLVKVDRVYRELEEATSHLLESFGEVESIVESARAGYRTHFNNLQTRLITAVQREGWPLEGMDSNQRSYDQLVEPDLRNSKRVVYFLVDALRLDLAQELESRLGPHQVEVKPGCALLPCVTKFGMASLLPDAENKLRFVEEAGHLLPHYDGKDVTTRADRLAVFERHLGDRVRLGNLADFIKATSTERKRTDFAKNLKGCDLYVLTSTELDAMGERETTSHLWQMPKALSQVQTALLRFAQLGFDEAVLATDHGFIWTDDIDEGSLVKEPPGEWPLKKRRCLIGTGDEGPGMVRFSCKEVGIPADAPSFVVPRALATFRRGPGYFHEGLSLQESLVPRMVVKFAEVKEAKKKSKPEIEISTKRKKVTARIITISLSWPGQTEMFAGDSSFRVIAVRNKEEIGYPTSNEFVDPASGLVRLKPGQSIKLGLRLADDTPEGPVTIKVLDPETEMEIASEALTFEPIVF